MPWTFPRAYGSGGAKTLLPDEGEIMGWRDCYREIKALIESKELKEMNEKANPNDPYSALSLALSEMYNEYNPWGHRI